MTNVHGTLTRYPSFDTLENFYRQSLQRRYSGEADSASTGPCHGRGSATGSPTSATPARSTPFPT